MITLGLHVKYAIEAFNRNEFFLALEQTSIALDMTAKKTYNSKVSNATSYKKLISDYLWLIELMSFPVLNLDKSTFSGFKFKDVNGKEYNKPAFQDIVYYIIRCNLIHGKNNIASKQLRFQQEDSIHCTKDMLILPIRMLWGLLGVIAFCTSNIDECTTDGYYLSINECIYPINISWGIQDLIQKQFSDKISSFTKEIIDVK